MNPAEEKIIVDFVKDGANARELTKLFETKEIDSFPPDENPFNFDYYQMGTYINKDLCIMWGSGGPNHPTQGITIVHIPTGRRLFVKTFEEV